MKNNKGFIISTTLYSAFGIMMITVASILFVLSTKTATMITMTDKLKTCIEECDTPENICEGVDGTTNPTLASLILGEQPDGSYDTTEQEGRGLYKSTDTNSGAPTYYFSGNNDKMNNYVSFGTWPNDVYANIDPGDDLYIEDFKNIHDPDDLIIDMITSNYIIKYASEGDPIIWRVLRINEDGSIRLITDHTIVDKDTSVGKTNFINYINSALAIHLNNWYTQTGFDETKLIEGTFCNDRSNTSTTTMTHKQCQTAIGYNLTYNVDYSDAVYRIENGNPTFKCSNSNTIKSYIGTISADEYFYSSKPKSFISESNNLVTMTANQISSTKKITSSGKEYTGNPTSNLYLISELKFNTIDEDLCNTKTYSGQSNCHSYAGDGYCGDGVQGYGCNDKGSSNMCDDYVQIANLRAVINLSPDVTVSGGSGLSKYSPYIIE